MMANQSTGLWNSHFLVFNIKDFFFLIRFTLCVCCKHHWNSLKYLISYSIVLLDDSYFSCLNRRLQAGNHHVDLSTENWFRRFELAVRYMSSDMTDKLVSYIHIRCCDMKSRKSLAQRLCARRAVCARIEKHGRETFPGPSSAVDVYTIYCSVM